jgi:hypothetical protein
VKGTGLSVKGTGLSVKGAGLSVKGTGFSPYINQPENEWGFSPRGRTADPSGTRQTELARKPLFGDT